MQRQPARLAPEDDNDVTAHADPAVRANRWLALRSESRGFLALGAVVVAAAVLCVIVALVRWPGDLKAWGEAGLVVALALGFDEVSRRTARLRIRLGQPLRADMTSVWVIAASVALPRGVALSLLVCILTYTWVRHQRPAGEVLHRKVFTASTILLGSFVAATVGHSVLGLVLHATTDDRQAVVPTAAVVVSVIVTYTVVQRALVTAGLLVLGARGRVLLGSRDDNLIEAATLCLGGLVALALHYQPLLAILSLAPMVTLHRGALVRELETAATTDAKTGLLNAVALDHLGQRELARAERENSPLAVLIVDIDRFKLVNDRHGHLVGDSVLRGVGRALTSGLREYDTIGRFGGEEFLAILPAADEAEALVVAERIRAQVATLRITDLDPRVAPGEADVLTVSIGVSCYGVDGLAMSDLLFAADAALYKAKAGGRNRVALAERGTGGAERATVTA